MIKKEYDIYNMDKCDTIIKLDEKKYVNIYPHEWINKRM